MHAWKTAAMLSLTAFLAASDAEVREWKTADGSRSINAEYVSAADGDVTIRRTDNRRIFTIPLETLSDADRAWVDARIQAEEEAAAKGDKSNPFAKLLTGEWEKTEGHGLEYRIFGARKLRGPDDTGYPLVIYLHGRGGDVMTPEEPGDARSFSADDSYRKRPCFIIAPQCTKDGSWDGANADAVIEIVEDLTKHLAIDEKRIYLTGYSMGGYGTFHLLGQEPKLFAAGVPVAGGGNPGRAADFKKVPLWVFHGAKDPTVKPEQSRRMVEALEDARGNVKYTEFPDGDHGIAGRVYGDAEVHEWLFEQRK